MKVTSTVRVKVEPGGNGVVAHVGLHALGSFADRMGLAGAPSSRLRGRTRRAAFHDRGKLIVQVALMLAGGGETCADIEHLRSGEDLFGNVASDSTVPRAIHEITPELRSELAEAVSEVRGKIWERTAQTKGTGPVYLGIGASLVEIHSENKQQTAATYRGLRFSPDLLLRRCDRRGAVFAVAAWQRRLQHRCRSRLCARRRP